MTEDEHKYCVVLGARIVKARGDLSQAKLAKALEISPNTMLRYEKGHVSPDIVTLRKICGITGASLLWLVNGEEAVGNGRISHLEDPFIAEIKLWLNEMTSDNPKWRVWFEMELIDKIPKFKEWLEKKRGGEISQQSSAA